MAVGVNCQFLLADWLSAYHDLFGRCLLQVPEAGPRPEGCNRLSAGSNPAALIKGTMTSEISDTLNRDNSHSQVGIDRVLTAGRSRQELDRISPAASRRRCLSGLYDVDAAVCKFKWQSLWPSSSSPSVVPQFKLCTKNANAAFQGQFASCFTAWWRLSSVVWASIFHFRQLAMSVRTDTSTN